jgi:hypothetical protein
MDSEHESTKINWCIITHDRIPAGRVFEVSIARGPKVDWLEAISKQLHSSGSHYFRLGSGRVSTAAQDVLQKGTASSISNGL